MLVPSIFRNDRREITPFEFEDLFAPTFFDMSPFADFEDIDRKLYGHKANKMMATDVKETDTSYEVDMNIPGFKKEDISISLKNGYITVETTKSVNNDEEKKGKVIRQERYTGAMRRSFYVGEDLTEEDIKAKFEHGVLKLSIPKKEEKAEDKAHTIEIEG